MKNLFLLSLTTLLLTAACSQNEPEDATQDYTSFVIFQNPSTNIKISNVVSGYFDSLGYCRKIASHGELSKGQYSQEDTLDFYVDSIYIFFGYNSAIRIERPFFVQPNSKNTFELNDDCKGLEVEMIDSTKYPH